MIIQDNEFNQMYMSRWIELFTFQTLNLQYSENEEILIGTDMTFNEMVNHNLNILENAISEQLIEKFVEFFAKESNRNAQKIL